MCNQEFTERGYLNHLYSSKEDGWVILVQEFYKQRFDSLNMDAVFISYEQNEFTYKCNLSGLVTKSRADRLVKHKICGCSVCQFKHKSEVSKDSWKNNYEKHCVSISKALLLSDKHRINSAYRCTTYFRNTFGNNSWSSYEKEIDDYLTLKGIKHEMNSVVLHYKETKNFIYDVYIPDLNILIELNNRHLTDHLYSYEELSKIKHLTTKYSVALSERIKHDLAITRGYKCFEFYDLKECKCFIEKLALSIQEGE